MAKSSFIFNFKRLPIAFLSGILLFLVVHIFILRSETFWRLCYLHSNPTGMDGVIRLEAQLRTTSKESNYKKVFLVGSSQTREGFDVEYLNSKFEKTDTIFYNLGISGNSHPIEVFMIKDKLLSKKPDVVIYMPFVGSFYYRYSTRLMKYYFNSEVLPYVLKYLGLKYIFLHKTAFIDSLFGEIFIFYRYKEPIKRVFFRAIHNFLGRTKRTKPKTYSYSENKPKSYFEEEIKKYKGKRYAIVPTTELDEELFTLFVKDVVSKGIKFIVIDGPTHPLIKKTYPREIDRRYNDFLSTQADEIGFIYLPDSRLPFFKEEDFIDFTHLNQKGRKKLSEFLENYLKEHLNLLN